MSKDEPDIAVLLDNAENMIAEGVDAVTFARKCVVDLRKQLFDCEAKLADCKAEKINRAEELAECKTNRAKAELKELIEAIRDNTVGIFAGKHGYDVPSPFPAPEDLWLFYARMFKAVLESHPGEFDGKECQEEVLSGVRAELAECKKELAEKPKADGPTPELLREFVEALVKGEVAEFGPNKGWVDCHDFEGKMPDYYREIAKLVLEPHPKGFDAWKAKYYPVPAKEVPKERAARASLLKYQGMLPEVLEEYGLVKKEDRGVLLADDKRVFVCEETTCALCVHYNHCRDCPLRSVTGRDCFSGKSVYQGWAESGDVSPLIKALEKAVELEKERYGEVMKAE